MASCAAVTLGLKGGPVNGNFAELPGAQRSSGHLHGAHRQLCVEAPSKHLLSIYKWPMSYMCYFSLLRTYQGTISVESSLQKTEAQNPLVVMKQVRMGHQTPERAAALQTGHSFLLFACF